MPVNTVLVVDDSPADLAKIKSIVADAGCVVLTATNGREAIDTAKARKPDLIFLDVIMPDMDGFQACRELTHDAETKHIPIVFVSSKDQKADRVWAKMQGGRDYVSKPYSAEQVLAQLG